VSFKSCERELLHDNRENETKFIHRNKHTYVRQSCCCNRQINLRIQIITGFNDEQMLTSNWDGQC